MTLIQAVALGVLQGLTEFLPVSSSGHLVLLQYLFNARPETTLAMTAVLHLGTAVALIAYFRRALAGIVASACSCESDRRRTGLLAVGYIALGSVPAALVGILAQARVEEVFAQPAIVGPMLLVTGAVVLGTRLASDRNRSLNWAIALAVGVAQAVAILPGISRSGATIAVALFLGLSRARAFEFSFVLSAPIVLAASVKELLEIDWSSVGPGAVAAGTLVAFVTGFAALVLLRRAVVGRGFYWFGFYCAAAGLAAILFIR